MAQASHQVVQLVVVHSRFLHLPLRCQNRIDPRFGSGAGSCTEGTDPPGGRARSSCRAGSRLRITAGSVVFGMKCFQQVRQVQLKEHALPAAAVIVHMARATAACSSGACSSSVELWSPSQWQVRRQVVPGPSSDISGQAASEWGCLWEQK